jgi:uncharacterized protein (DUF952 family)
MPTIYKICRAAEWTAAQAAGVYRGSEVDRRDGFIHFSTVDSVVETARRHFAGVADLVLVGFDDAKLGEALRYEPARGGTPFPHLYGSLDPKAALWVTPLPLGADGAHAFPALLT